MFDARSSAERPYCSYPVMKQGSVWCDDTNAEDSGGDIASAPFAESLPQRGENNLWR